MKTISSKISSLLLACFSWLLLPNLFAQSDSATASSASLRDELAAYLAQPRFERAMWGVKVVSLEAGKVIFEHNAGKLLKPASNAKLFTGALALDRLGPDHRIRTSFHADAAPDADGVLHGDLIVYGRGDPTFSSRFLGATNNAPLASLVDALAAAGVKRVKGNLVGDESYFQGPPLGSSWAWSDLQYYYGAEVSALTVQDNVVDLLFHPAAKVGDPCRIEAKPGTPYLVFNNLTRTVEPGGGRSISVYRPVGKNEVRVSGSLPLGSAPYSAAVAVHDPAGLFVAILKEAMERRGIVVEGGTRTVGWPEQSSSSGLKNKIELAAVESRPLREIVTQMMKPSQNLYAQLLLLQVGAVAEVPARNRHTEDRGVAEMGRFLKEAGIAPGEVLLDEGSGLSRAALLTPASTIKLLLHMHRHRWAEAFMDSLPVAGRDGTLRTRMKGTPAEKNLRAKTGTIRFVNCLSGHVTTAGGERLVFSFMLNNFSSADPNESGRDHIDALAVKLASFKGRAVED